ncbi:MAG: hypothetical protein LN413_03180 [Candidatus Thermoplasmatota archaeon]|nr:hypothetical protein [Candidatus Thermoplasmatota archaeon]
MLDLGMAFMEQRRHDRRLGALQSYLRIEYGSASGMERYIAEANHAPSPRSGFRAFLAKIAGAVTRPPTQAATPAISVEQALSGDGAEHTTPVARVAPAATSGPVRYRRRSNVRPHTALPPPKR